MKNDENNTTAKREELFVDRSYNYTLEDEESLYINSSDENRLKSMSEKKRQEILYERYLKVISSQEKKEIDKKLMELEKSKHKGKESFGSGISDKKVIYSLKDFAPCILNRDFLIINVDKIPSNTFVGHFVKVKVKDDYHLSKIGNIRSGEVYTVKCNKINIRTNKTLDLISDNTKFDGVSIQFISNTAIDEEDFTSFKLSNPNFNYKKHLLEFNNLKKTILSKSRKTNSSKAPEEKPSFANERKKNILLKIGLIKKREKALEMKKFLQAEAIQQQIDELNEAEDKEKNVWALISERNRKINASIAKLKSESLPESINEEDICNTACKRKKTRNNNYDC